jgi:hypothetical protein
MTCEPVYNNTLAPFLINCDIIVSSCSTAFERTLDASHGRFRNLIKTLGRTLSGEWSAHRKGLYLHNTTKHRNTRTNIHDSGGIRTHHPSNQAAKTYALALATAGTGNKLSYSLRKLFLGLASRLRPATNCHIVYVNYSWGSRADWDLQQIVI